MPPGNFENCKQCEHKYTCLQYLNNLEKAVSISSELSLIPEESTVDTISPVTMEVEYTKDDTIISETIESLPEAVVDEVYENENLTNALAKVEAGIVVYDAESAPLKKGDTYYEEKKTLFGGTKMVEKVVK